MLGTKNEIRGVVVRAVGNDEKPLHQQMASAYADVTVEEAMIKFAELWHMGDLIAGRGVSLEAAFFRRGEKIELSMLNDGRVVWPGTVRHEVKCVVDGFRGVEEDAA